MYTLLIGIIVVALSLGLLTVWPVQPDTADDDLSFTEYEVERAPDASVSSDQAAVPVARDGLLLDLSGQGLTQPPGDMFSRTATTQLDLSDNQLTGAMPAEIRLLSNLIVLDLSNNNFTGVPAEIGQLQQLEVLNLANNQITGLPYELGNLANLQLLDLRGNQYAAQDLARIKETLPATVQILVD